MAAIYNPQVAQWNELYVGVKDVFDTLGIPLFSRTYVMFLILFLLILGFARLLYSFWKGGG